ncbi:MAG TPA: ABC transporter permease [Thermoanaerobaculia bacterium]|jgi:ABC-2 type transport system permease protein|nr:ABC transporter permease [Thermoanaerobaculia bacterium]
MPNFDRILVIAKRDYLSRVRTPAFWITTVILPLLMSGWVVLPSLIMSKSRGGLRLAVVDETGKVAPVLAKEIAGVSGAEGPKIDLTLKIEPPAADAGAQRKELDRRALGDEIDAWLWITPKVFDDNKVEYHGRTLSNFITLERVERLLTRVVREQRLAAAGYDAKKVEKLVEGVDLAKTQVTEKGGRAGGGIGDIILAAGLFIILYMTIIIYGQMMMHGVLEEKANRVVEVIVSTTTPAQLMAGKLVGICGVALTQIGVWLLSAAVVTGPLMAARLPAGASANLPTLSPTIIAHFIALFLLGFVLYASWYALIGAAFNSPQEAQQLASIGVFFVVVPWMVFMPVLNDPDSTMATVISLIPLFTPMIMMLRIAVKMPPAWQLALAYTLTLLADLGMVWLCARVYRVGILMYGKKPSIKEIWRWTRYA